MKYKQGRFCFLSNLRNFLLSHHIELAEDELGLILGYTGFYFTKEELSHQENIHGRSSDFDTLFERYQNVFGLVYLDLPLNGIWTGIKACKSQQLVWLDHFYIPHSPHFKANHFYNIVIVDSIENDYIQLFDNRTFQMDKNCFLSAIRKNKGKGTTYFLKTCYDLKYDLTALKYEGLTLTKSRLLGEQGAGNYEYGISGMNILLKSIEAFTPQQYNNLYYQMSRPGGVSAVREEFASVCRTMNLQVSEQYLELAHDWRIVANTFFRLSKNTDDAVLSRLKIRIEQCIDKEEHTIQQID